MSAPDHTPQDGAGDQPAPEAGEPVPTAAAEEPVPAPDPPEDHDGVVPVSAHPEAEPEDPAPLPDPPAEPDFKDLYLRERAELENVRKRARRDVEVSQKRGIARLAKELLPALDNLERALAAAQAAEGDGQDHITSGLRLVQQELIASLERVGIVADAPAGEPFDPHRHEAVAQTPAEGVESGVIVEVYSAGYRFGDDVLRAAKVVVAQ